MTLHILRALSLVMPCLLAPVAYGFLPAFFAFTDLLSGQRRSVGFLTFGFGPLGRIAGVLPGGILSES